MSPLASPADAFSSGPPGPRRSVHLRVFPAPDVPPSEALWRLRDRRGLVLCESAAGEPRRVHLLAFDPLVQLVGTDGESFVELLRRALGACEFHGVDDVPGPFAGGFVGALSYDLGAAGERPVSAPPEPWGFPDLLGGIYSDFLVWDLEAGETWLVLGEDGERTDVDARRADVLNALTADDESPPTPRALGPLVRHTQSALHRRRIERAIEFIASGDVYQVNLAHRFTRAVRADPLALYRRLRDVNPAPFSSFLSWDGPAGSEGLEGSSGRRGALLSSSPELLFEFDGREARTRPIKGTAARGASPAQDRARVRELLESEKDRAELVMIVDLERNDLGRVATPAGVRVEGLPTLQTYASVHHLVADVVAEVRAGVDAIDVLAALFPGGSITGAPKLRSMDVIAELEGEARGFFTGSLGWIDARGRARFNILIRTLLWRGRPDGLGEVSFRVGGGITFSSDPEAEDRETLAKAAGLAAALAADGEDPWRGVRLASDAPRVVADSTATPGAEARP